MLINREENSDLNTVLEERESIPCFLTLDLWFFLGTHSENK